MEINEIHSRILGSIEAMEDLQAVGLEPTGHLERLAALVRLLDEQLRAGGRLPDAWVLRNGANASVSEPQRLDDAPNGAHMYRITVSGFEVSRHRTLAGAAIRLFARQNNMGRASLKSSGGTYGDVHGTSEFTYAVSAKKIGRPTPSNNK